MKVVAFNGSPRTNGNTFQALAVVLDELEKNGVSTKMINLCEHEIHGCKACGSCFKNKDKKCIMKDDKVNDYVELITKCDGLIIGSPVYFGSLSSQTKAFIDRVGYVNRANGDLFKRKVGAAVAINRRLGGVQHDQQFLPYRADDRPGIELLEHRNGIEAGGVRKRCGRGQHHASPGTEHCLAVRKVKFRCQQRLGK